MELERRGNQSKTHCGFYFPSNSDRVSPYGDIQHTGCAECRSSYIQSEHRRIKEYANLKRSLNFINRHQKDAFLSVMRENGLRIKDITAMLQHHTIEDRLKVCRFHFELKNVSVLTAIEFQSQVFNIPEKTIKKRILDFQKNETNHKVLA